MTTLLWDRPLACPTKVGLGSYEQSRLGEGANARQDRWAVAGSTYHSINTQTTDNKGCPEGSNAVLAIGGEQDDDS